MLFKRTRWWNLLSENVTTFLNTDLKDAIADPNWNGKTILSLGGWAEGYTFEQGVR